ncbi:MAG: DUF2165 domain-containing protein [Acidimicrobiia bacterium]|nr:DUF2165 domain-containing protein [Acidimicrobiia bacterium]
MDSSLPAAEIAFRLIPLLLVAGTAAMGVLIVFNNVTAPQSNFQFVQHVMSMDTTFQDKRLMWRAINSPALHWVAYVTLVLSEIAVTVLGTIGTYYLAINLNSTGEAWESAKLFGYLTFFAALTIWFFIFQVIGAEWFESWQSEKWNGIRDSIRINLISVAGAILLRLA